MRGILPLAIVPLLVAGSLTACGAERAVRVEIELDDTPPTAPGDSLCIVAYGADTLAFAAAYELESLPPGERSLTFVAGPRVSETVTISALVLQGGAITARATSLARFTDQGTLRQVLRPQRCRAGGPAGLGARPAGAFAALAPIVLGIQRTGRLTHSINAEHYHDIGKWMFAFTFFWAYTAFSQFMLQWYGNMPEETVWYKYRLFGEWQWVSIAMLVGFWAFPFVFLLSRWTKRIVPSLVFFAVWQ
nr:hypothetical protein [Myxococcota bacterium]